MSQPCELVSVVIVSLNGASVLPQCLRSLQALDWPDAQLEIIVVNNGSSDATPQILEEWRPRGVKPIHLPRNLGFAGGNNVGMRRARGEWVILLNDDTEVEPEWVCDLMNVARAHPEAGILGSLLFYPDRRTIQHAGGVVHANALTAHIGQGQENAHGQLGNVRECDYVTGAAFAIRRAVIDRIGYLDASYWPIYFEEIDYCWRARAAGFSILMTPARAIHHESRTTVAYSQGFLRKYHRNRLRFALLNFPARRLASFVRSELRWLFQTWRHLPRRILLESYLRAGLFLPFWLAKRRKVRVVP